MFTGFVGKALKIRKGNEEEVMMKVDAKNLITFEDPYNFYSESGDRFPLDLLDWPELLALAYVYGWQPTGTLEPFSYDPIEDYESLCGCLWDPMEYAADAYQWVKEEDAANMADALERALEDLPADLNQQEIHERIRLKLGDMWFTKWDYQRVCRWRETSKNYGQPGLYRPIEDWIRTGEQGIGPEGTGITEWNALSISQWYVDNRDIIKDFIKFCRKGEFCVR
jgi:hypothetical protein